MSPENGLALIPARNHGTELRKCLFHLGHSRTSVTYKSPYNPFDLKFNSEIFINAVALHTAIAHKTVCEPLMEQAANTIDIRLFLPALAGPGDTSTTWKKYRTTFSAGCYQDRATLLSLSVYRPR